MFNITVNSDGCAAGYYLGRYALMANRTLGPSP